MKNLSIKAKLLAIVISSIMIVSIAILIESNLALYNSSHEITEKFEKEAYASKEAELRNYVEVAVKAVESFYKRAKENPENIQQIKETARITIQEMKYGKDGYYWINDSNHIVVMHGAKPQLAGKDMTDLQDPNGVYVYKEIVKAGNSGVEGGLVKYMWSKPGYDEPQPKFSYVIRVPQWDWIIGTGAYVDNIDVKIQAMKAATEENIFDTMITNILIILVIMAILAYIMLLISKKTIFEPLEKFQTGLMGFFQYLNKEQKDVEFLDDEGKDEIAIMSREVNQNIQKAKTLIEQDAVLINDVKRVVEEVKAGYLHKKIEKTTQNEALQELQVIFNEMLAIMEKNVHDDINELTDVLHKFKERDFRKRIENPKGDVAVTLNELAEIINKTFLDNLTNGSILNENAETLRGNVEQLSVSSNQQAASLEETAAALEEITSTITNTSENITEMGTYTNELNTSINQGQELASQTTASMEEINEQTELIADAITVIDQIAFQTNILSLNAAVEAATAGEAGKGFAVVAQEVRNLASRSAEAAKEIKDIVENATSKANSGKEISAKMIQGYEEIAQKVQQTNQIITSITTASKEQTAGIAQINDAVAELDKATQENANVASNTSSIANETSKMAIAIVDEANESEFLNKESVSIKKRKTAPVQAAPSPTYTAPQEPVHKPTPAKSTSTSQVISPNNQNDDEWESF